MPQNRKFFKLQLLASLLVGFRFASNKTANSIENPYSDLWNPQIAQAG